MFYTDHAAPGPQKDSCDDTSAMQTGSIVLVSICSEFQCKFLQVLSFLQSKLKEALSCQEGDFMRVIVPKQSVTREDDGWLYHRRLRVVPEGKFKHF